MLIEAMTSHTIMLLMITNGCRYRTIDITPVLDLISHFFSKLAINVTVKEDVFVKMKMSVFENSVTVYSHIAWFLS